MHDHQRVAPRRAVARRQVDLDLAVLAERRAGEPPRLDRAGARVGGPAGVGCAARGGCEFSSDLVCGPPHPAETAGRWVGRAGGGG